MSSLPLQFLLLTVAGWMTRNERTVAAYLIAENAVLLEQLGPKRILYTDAQRRRLAIAGRALGRNKLSRIDTLVTPDTLLRWYRRLVAKKYDGSARRGVGRPHTRVDIGALVLRMARENSGWGYTRIAGALRNLGHDISRNTIKRILLDAGIDPAPVRRRGLSWSDFLRAHWGAIAAMDFFTVEVLTLGGLVRHHVLFVIDLATRRVEICGVSVDPDGTWMKQMARNLTDEVDGFLLKHRHLIMDRDPVFTRDFRRMLKDRGVKSVRLPSRSPNLNAFAERFIRSVRQECLSKVIPLGGNHLREVLDQYMAHYHVERNHQGLGNVLLTPANDNHLVGAPVIRRKRLGGLLSYYHRRAA